jgi:hypothetical protein
MSSDRRIEANRRNAQKSTGPITPEGKAKSSLNSLRHGLLARTVVLDGESTDRFHELLASLQDELQPEGAVEYILVEIMAVACWCQRRLWGLHSAGLRSELQKQHAAAEGEQVVFTSPVGRASLAFRALADNGRSLDLINRYQTSYERQYHRSYRQLMEIHEKRDSSKRSQSPGPDAA